MRLVYRGKLPEGESEWLNSLDSLEIRRLANLHAKCCMNENEALITSLNLYEYSRNHNVEWGILVSRRDDEELYQEIFKEAVHIFRLSDVEKESVKRPQPTTGRTPGNAPPHSALFSIPASPSHPSPIAAALFRKTAKGRLDGLFVFCPRHSRESGDTDGGGRRVDRRCAIAIESLHYAKARRGHGGIPDCEGLHC